MKAKSKLAFGAVLGSFGGLVTIFGPAFGITHFSYPWSFIIGFVTGLMSGTGIALVISGLIKK